ncbi:uncharacterized protein LOC122733788 [Dromiciops gliroides]|uniref:uncharacterized protein LOC122733788 n=1 Tax=Dromiciops gliroides TaxID=33562 RepID=UPI001CC6D8A4|nr:uncharacterized protein LOC122733788 [Dromiciops gliroides]
MDFSTAIQDVASHYLSIFVIGFYILGSLQEGRELIILVTQVLSLELLIPMHLALMKTLHVLRTYFWWFLSTLFHWSQRCNLSLWRELRQKQGKVLFDWTQQAYIGLVIFCQKNSNACKSILDKTTRQLLFTSLLEYLDKFWVLVYQWTQIMITFSIRKQVKTWWGFHSTAVPYEPYAPILPGCQQTSDPMSTRADLTYCKRPSPRFHRRQIPGRAHKVKREKQEL